jgi:hypothetical protein
MSDRRPTTPELSRPVPVERIGTRWQSHAITVDAAERAALARRFELLELPALDAEVRLRRARAGRYVEIAGTLRASVVQSCVVTLDPVPASFEERFDLMLGPIDGGPAEAGASDLIVDLDDPEPLDGDSVDIGELVAQQLSLALDPYPRSAAAGDSVEVSAADPEPAPADNPFAALSARRKPR